MPINLEQCQIVVHLPEPCLAVLREQLAIDLDAKKRGWSPIPFEKKELAHLERLITRHSASGEPILPGDSVTYTHDEQKFIARYVGRYRLRAKESEARQPFLAYELLLRNLLNDFMLIPAVL